MTWSKERIEELYLAPHHCGRYVGCEGWSCKNCIKAHASIFSKVVLKENDFRIGEAAKQRILEVFKLKNDRRYSREELKEMVIEYITTDFKTVFNELKEVQNV